LNITCADSRILKLQFKRSRDNNEASRSTGPNCAMAKKISRQFSEYFAGRRKEFSLPVDIDKLKGTAFQKKVWKELLNIPFGQAISYEELAKRIRQRRACRAVGNANGMNPIPILIPCHRVIAKNGGLGGYSSGMTIKRNLLKLEGVL
jgi:O-6-methylguanine DNA methyltransferase